VIRLAASLTAMLVLASLAPAQDTPASTQPALQRKWFQGQRVQVKDTNWDKWENYTIYRVGKYHCYVTKDDTPFDSNDGWVEDARIRPMPAGVTPKPPQKRGSLWLIKPDKVGVEPPKPATPVDENGSNLVSGDTSNAKEPDTKETASTYAPDVAPTTRPAQGTIGLKGSGGGELFCPVRSTGKAIVVSGEAEKGQIVERLNLFTNQNLGASQLPSKVKVIGAAADGSRVLTIQEQWGKKNENLLMIFDITKPTAVELRRFMPFASSADEGFKSVNGGCILPDGTLLTVSFWGQAALWPASAAQDSKDTPAAIWTAPAHSGALRYTLSPSGKYIAFSAGQSDRRVIIVETATGNTVHIAPKGFVGIASALSDDGSRLLTLDANRLVLYSLPDNQVLLDTASPANTNDAPAFLSNDYAFVGETLFDLSIGVPLWSYPGSKASTVLASRLYYLPNSADSKPRLRSLTLPDQGALDAHKQLVGKPDLYALQSGDSVQLDLSIGDNAEPKLAQRLTQALTNSGYKVADNSHIKLVARVENGETKHVVYRITGFGIAGIREREADVQTRKWKLSLELDGKPLWTRTGTDNGPVSIQIKEGQTIDQAIAAARSTPDNLFPVSDFPKKFPSPQYAKPQGTTDLSR
jgi:hypothetical protein